MAWTKSISGKWNLREKSGWRGDEINCWLFPLNIVPNSAKIRPKTTTFWQWTNISTHTKAPETSSTRTAQNTIILSTHPPTQRINFKSPSNARHWKFNLKLVFPPFHFNLKLISIGRAFQIFGGFAAYGRRNRKFPLEHTQMAVVRKRRTVPSFFSPATTKMLCHVELRKIQREIQISDMSFAKLQKNRLKCR